VGAYSDSPGIEIIRCAKTIFTLCSERSNGVFTGISLHASAGRMAKGVG